MAKTLAEKWFELSPEVRSKFVLKSNCCNSIVKGKLKWQSFLQQGYCSACGKNVEDYEIDEQVKKYIDNFITKHRHK